jgi:hypothetical protein
MSEAEFNSPPEFARTLPEAVANDELNHIIRSALNEAVAAENRNDYATLREYGEAVAEEFYNLLGTGAIAAELEEMAEELPSQYLGETDVYETALQYVDRIDYQSYAHPAVLSPLLALTGRDGGTYFVGTDKMAHFVQQSYDYYFIYRTVEENHPGLGELYARCWGLWGEGIEITDDYVMEYLESHNLPSDPQRVHEIREDITTFMEDSDTVMYLSPNPAFVNNWVVFRWLAHNLIGTHQFGVYGSTTTGIISYSDIAVNEAGFKFYMNLIEDPEGIAANFDITDYVTPEWDEEILRSTFSPVIEERIEEAKGSDIKWPFVYGIDARLAGPPWTFSASLPVLYHMWRDIEWRMRLGATMPLEFDETVLSHESQGFASFDMAMRISGLNFWYLTATAGFSKAIASDEPMDGFHPIIEIGYEVMFLGWTSLRFGFMFDINDYVPSFVVGIMRIWR